MKLCDRCTILGKNEAGYIKYKGLSLWKEIEMLCPSCKSYEDARSSLIYKAVMFANKAVGENSENWDKCYHNKMNLLVKEAKIK